MSHMFHGAESFSQNLNNWNTANVVDFEAMFEDAKKMQGDISTWDTRSAKSMKRMFRGAAKIQRRSSWMEYVEC